MAFVVPQSRDGVGRYAARAVAVRMRSDCMTEWPTRKKLPHDVPSWVKSGAVWFITVNALPRGINHLCNADVANAVWDAVRFNVGRGLWWPHLFLLMPDHLHGLFGFAQDASLRKIVSDWKHYTAHELDLDWQRDFFDHRLRRDESFDEKAYYIRQNPVRKGLARKADDWPYVWTMAEHDSAVDGATALPDHGSAVDGATALPENGTRLNKE